MPIVLNGTTGITNDSGYTGDGVSFADSTPANTLVTTAGGNVGIGTSSPNTAYRFTINGVGTAGNPLGGILFRQGAVDVAWLGSVARDNDTDVEFWNPRNGYMRFATNNTERARITANGNLLVGAASIIGSSLVGIYRASLFFSGDCLALQDGNSTTGGAFVSFKNESGTNIGTISRNGASSVAYNTSSDYRLKDNIAPMTGALARVSALKPVTYTWKADGSADEGFIAHELAEVCPAAVTGAKDAVEVVDVKDDEGNVIGTEERPVYQGIDTSFLVATLTAAIQELKAINDAQAQTIESLTARVVALENQIV